MFQNLCRVVFCTGFSGRPASCATGSSDGMGDAFGCSRCALYSLLKVDSGTVKLAMPATTAVGRQRYAPWMRRSSGLLSLERFMVRPLSLLASPLGCHVQE